MNPILKTIYSALFITFLSITSNAGEVILKNGDRITGRIISKDSDALSVETTAMGVVKIKLPQVESYRSDEELVATLTDGNLVKGKVRSEGSVSIIESLDGETKSFENDLVKTIRTPDDQRKFDIAQSEPKRDGLFAFWSGTLDIGFSMTAGNSDTRSFTGAFRGVREKPTNKLAVYANALQVRNSTNGPVRITGQSIWSGARLDADITKKFFVFGSGDFEYNKPQKLDVRAVLGAGAGYHVYRGDRLALNFTGGFTNNYENFSTGLTRNSAEALIGQDLRLRINNRARLTNRFVLYPNLSNAGNYRALLDASLQTDLNNWLGWHVTIGNRYNSRPVSTTEKNDFLMSTGLRVSFGKNRKK